MKWLQWSTIDLENGPGGVEAHARRLARELNALGIQTVFSREPKDLNRPEWGVVHTHGSAFLRPSTTGAVRVHTLHGTTLGRMFACREWSWAGGYAAAWRELQALRQADVVLSVHPDLSLYRQAQRWRKIADVCWNGYDIPPGDRAIPLSQDLKAEIGEHAWVFIGRGNDPVKGADRFRALRSLLPEVMRIAVPGDGFERDRKILKTQSLTPDQIGELLRLVEGVIIPSYYEGLPLVMLEALGEGVPVVATPVGGIPTLPVSKLQGLVLADSGDPRALADAVRRAQRFSKVDRAKRKENNRRYLHTWAEVAKTYLQAVERFKKRAQRKSS